MKLGAQYLTFKWLLFLMEVRAHKGRLSTYYALDLWDYGAGLSGYRVGDKRVGR